MCITRWETESAFVQIWKSELPKMPSSSSMLELCMLVDPSKPSFSVPQKPVEWPFLGYIFTHINTDGWNSSWPSSMPCLALPLLAGERQARSASALLSCQAKNTEPQTGQTELWNTNCIAAYNPQVWEVLAQSAPNGRNSVQKGNMEEHEGWKA